MAELAREEVETLSAALEASGEALKLLLLPRDPLDDRNIMLEVCVCGWGWRVVWCGCGGGWLLHGGGRNGLVGETLPHSLALLG